MSTGKPPIPIDDLDLASLSLWLQDNMLPNARSFLQNGSITSALIAPQTWTALPLAGWSNFAGGFQVAQYGLDALGFVHLRGLVTFAAAWSYGITVATLPAGYRPAAIELFLEPLFDSTTGNVIARVDVAATGTIKVQASVPAASGSAVTFLGLSGITFKQGA